MIGFSDSFIIYSIKKRWNTMRPMGVFSHGVRIVTWRCSGCDNSTWSKKLYTGEAHYTHSISRGIRLDWSFQSDPIKWIKIDFNFQNIDFKSSHLIFIFSILNRFSFFESKLAAKGRRSFTTLQKCTTTIHQLAYDTRAGAWDEYWGCLMKYIK